MSIISLVSCIMLHPEKKHVAIPPSSIDRMTRLGGDFLFKRQCHDNRWFLAAILCGKNNGGHKTRPWKTTIAWGKQHFLDSAWAVKLFARLTELSWSDVRDTCTSSHHYLLAQKRARKYGISWHCPINYGIFAQAPLEKENCCVPVPYGKGFLVFRVTPPTDSIWVWFDTYSCPVCWLGKTRWAV